MKYESRCNLRAFQKKQMTLNQILPDFSYSPKKINLGLSFFKLKRMICEGVKKWNLIQSNIPKLVSISEEYFTNSLSSLSSWSSIVPYTSCNVSGILLCLVNISRFKISINQSFLLCQLWYQSGFYGVQYLP